MSSCRAECTEWPCLQRPTTDTTWASRRLWKSNAAWEPSIWKKAKGLRQLKADPTNSSWMTRACESRCTYIHLDLQTTLRRFCYIRQAVARRNVPWLTTSTNPCMSRGRHAPSTKWTRGEGCPSRGVEMYAHTLAAVARRCGASRYPDCCTRQLLLCFHRPAAVSGAHRCSIHLHRHGRV